MNAKISQAIMDQVAAGKTIEEAVDAVLGEGTYRTISDNLYAALRGE